MVRAHLVYITDGNALHIGVSAKVVDYSPRVRADTDERHVDLVAGPNVAGPAKHVTGNDGDAKAHGAGLRQEPAS